MEYAGYDLIGDVHGCGWTLQMLLERLGYQQRNGVFEHPERQAIFIGDIVDRGPHIREALQIVRGMVDAGSAQMVMGNHEHYVLAWFTEAPAKTDRAFLRDHSPRHQHVIRETLQQFSGHQAELEDYLQWFLDLPLFLELDGFRCVHACWDQAVIDRLKAERGGAAIDLDFLQEAAQYGSFAHRAMDRLLRGISVPLPAGHQMTSSEGFPRKAFRSRFWARNPQTYGDIVFQPDRLPEEVEDMPLSGEDKQRLLTYAESLPPLFFGHYWMEGTPQPLRANLVCLDYSAVKYGSLVAYRYDREPVLSADKFVWVDVDRD